MVRMSTADFISLISNLKEEVDITVSINNKDTEDKKVLSKYEVFTNGINKAESDSDITSSAYNVLNTSILFTHDGLPIKESIAKGELELKIINAFHSTGCSLTSFPAGASTITAYKTVYVSKDIDTLTILQSQCNPPPILELDMEDGTIKNFIVSYIKQTNKAFDVSSLQLELISFINASGESLLKEIENTNPKKELSVAEVLEQKITKAFLDIGYDVNKVDKIPLFPMLSCKTNYYCSETDSYLLILHPYLCPPNAFAIDDRGITKMFISKDHETTNEIFDAEHPIKVVM